LRSQCARHRSPRTGWWHGRHRGGLVSQFPRPDHPSRNDRDPARHHCATTAGLTVTASGAHVHGAMQGRLGSLDRLPPLAERNGILLCQRRDVLVTDEVGNGARRDTPSIPVPRRNMVTSLVFYETYFRSTCRYPWYQATIVV